MTHTGGGYLRWIALVIAAGILLCSGLVARIYQAGNDAMRQSEDAFDRGDLTAATNAAREAATWYLPGVPHVANAHARLRAIAVGSEAQGDLQGALRAWGALRSALVETHHPWSQRAAELTEANRGVARLLLTQQNQDTARRTDAEQGRDTDVYQAYSNQPHGDGRALFAVLTTLGMALMLAFGARLLSGRPMRSSASVLFARTGLAVGLGMWVLAALGH